MQVTNTNNSYYAYNKSSQSVTQKEFESISYEMLDKFKTLVLPTNDVSFEEFPQDDLEVFYIKGISGEINNISPDVMKQITLDFQKVLLDIINMSNDYIETVKDPQVLKQLHNTKNFYSSVLNNYNELKNESSYEYC